MISIFVVSAASIIAKVIRDNIINEYKKEFGDFGSGYPSDIKTVEFLKRYYEIHNKLPPIAREKWKTCKRLKGETLDRWL
ncbi:ribonuclease HII [Methanocaldococcus villosus KIN24-T80]|uniref:Ribonuclease n=1 Tax=Methanocaldococcus villosus KIN24-T80 TaxID=1069083 RepID=N6V1T9_9EURY|nr:ribonuclease HII [Methanocaldococcus villosus KIN24-T80]